MSNSPVPLVASPQPLKEKGIDELDAHIDVDESLDGHLSVIQTPSSCTVSSSDTNVNAGPSTARLEDDTPASTP